MHPLIEDVQITYDETEGTVEVIIIENEDKKDVFNLSLTKNGTFRFSYVHPEDSTKYRYKGYIHDGKVMIYPIIGDGVISRKPIKLNIK